MLIESPFLERGAGFFFARTFLFFNSAGQSTDGQKIYTCITWAPVFQQFAAPGNLSPQVRVWFMIPVLYRTSIAIAIYSKSAWSFADIRVVGARPYMGYAAAAAAAVVAAFVIQLLLRFVQGGNLLQIFSETVRFTAAFATNVDRWPWHVLAFFRPGQAASAPPDQART